MDLRRTWPTIGLAVLLVLDLVLVVWALWPSSRGTPGDGPVVTVTATASPSSSATSNSAGTRGAGAATPSAVATTGAQPEAAAAVPLTRLVVPVGGRAVWTADVGTCAARGRLHVSDDLGKSWTTHRAEGSVTRIRPDGASAAFVVGGTRRCQLRLWTTSDQGASWNGPRSAAAAWGRSPRDGRLVHRPDGASVTPCSGRSPVLDLAVVDRTNATVLCGNGTLRRTSDGGAGWSTGLTRRGAAALALSSAGTGVVASVDASCEGVVVEVLADGELGSDRCVSGVDPAPGSVALGVASSGVWLSAGDAVLRATEPGDAFARVSDWPSG